MRNVLFVAYHLPPLRDIGGALRSASFVRYLPRFGWQPTVIALDGGQRATARVVRLPSPTPYHRPYELGPYGWSFALHHHLRRSSGPYDLVYVSCPPYPPALVAANFAVRLQLPLVVDFRDAWTLGPYKAGSRANNVLYRHVFPRLEKRLIERTDLLILNTPSALATYQAHYADCAHRMAWLPNGLDAAVFPESPAAVEGEELRLLYAGRFGVGARSADNLLAALALARAAGCKVRLEILGDQPSAVSAGIEQSGTGDAVCLRGQLPYEQAVAAMCGAGALVLVQADSSAPIRAVAGKTFDYLGAGRPVLYIGPSGDNLDLVERYAPRYEHPVDSPSAIADAIMRLHDAWQRGELSNTQAAPAVREKFDRRTLTVELAQHFDRLASRKPA